MAIAVGDLLRIDTELVRVIFALCLLKERFPNAGPCNLKARYPINRIDRQAQAGHCDFLSQRCANACGSRDITRANRDGRMILSLRQRRSLNILVC